jgi:hypothetical protein
MNEQYFGDRINPSDLVEGTNKDVNSQVVNSDPFADKVPVDAALIHETPMGGTVAAVGPLNNTLADEKITMNETPVQEIPMGETVAPVGRMDGTIVHEALLDETIPYKAPLDETITDESLVSKSIPYKAPLGETITQAAPIGTNTGSVAALLNREESDHFRTRWNEIQGKFVDEPRTAVQQADALVTEVIGQITQMFAAEHSSLVSQWDKGNEASTEDLRKALQRYRSFFNRLVV